MRIYPFNDLNFTLRHNLRIVKSAHYNYIFSINNGFFARWGKSPQDDPPYSPFGPELLDIEVSTICHRKCLWCYKSNTTNGKNMCFETFRIIFDKIPKNLTQIAFGIGDLDANPDLWKMFAYCRKNNVVPNITINGYRINDEMVEELVKYCGAVAVSHYDNDVCFDAIKLLSDKGLKHINIHKLVALETLNTCYDLLDAVKTDYRLKGLNAIVFLALKEKGTRNDFHTLPKEDFTKLVQYALKNRIRIGFDSCSANKFLEVVKDHPDNKMFEMASESCESSCFSLYINVNGIVYPCSFLEGESGSKGINIIKIKKFLKELWFSENFRKFRRKLLRTNGDCPQFNI